MLVRYEDIEQIRERGKKMTIRNKRRKKEILIVTCRVRTCAPPKGLPVYAHRKGETNKQTLKERNAGQRVRPLRQGDLAQLVRTVTAIRVFMLGDGKGLSLRLW